MRKFVEVLISLIIISGASVYLSLLFWQALLWAVAVSQKAGLSFSLVGGPQSIDPGAVVVSLIFFIVWVLIAWRSFKQHKRHLGYVFGLSAPFSAFFVFAQVSSLAWY